MVELSISDISKKPSLLDELDDIAKIVNKKTHEIKGIFVPYEDSKLFHKLFKELEYKKWLERNRAGLMEKPDFLDDVVEDIREKL